MTFLHWLKAAMLVRHIANKLPELQEGQLSVVVRIQWTHELIDGGWVRGVLWEETKRTVAMIVSPSSDRHWYCAFFSADLLVWGGVPVLDGPNRKCSDVAFFHCLLYSFRCKHAESSRFVFMRTSSIRSFYNFRVFLGAGFVLFPQQNHKHVTHKEFFRGLGCG